MKNVLSKQQSFTLNGKKPLNYRDFIETQPEMGSQMRRRFLLRIHMKGGSRLSLLFESGQWCFGDKIVDLAGLEDLEQVLPGNDANFKFPFSYSY